jgi:formylglycine-generating enzyme required for sulfatase activity
MKKISIVFSLFVSLFMGCNSSQRVETGTEADSPASSPVNKTTYFEEANSGTGLRIAVLVPNYQNFNENEDSWLPVFTQGILTNNFNKYSAMTVLDRQNMDKILDEQKLSLSGNFSDDDYIRIGNLTNAQYILSGTILKISDNECSLQLAISDTETSIRKASYATNCRINELKETTILKEASYELLTQMGVRLTQAGKQALYDSGNASFVESETALSQGIVAEKNGTTIAALSYYYNANYYDPSSSEAASRLNVLSSTVSNGNIRETARNDIERRRAWRALMDESEAFFRDHPPFDLVYQTSLEQTGVDYDNETIELTIQLGLFPTTGLKALQNMLDGLAATGKKDEWGFQDWPLSANSDTFMSKDFGGFTISVSLLNDANEVIANRRYVVKNPLSINKEGNALRLILESQQFTWDFPPINVNDISDTVTVRIDSINGIPAEIASANGYMRIITEEEYKNALFVQPVEMVAVAEKAKKITITYRLYVDFIREYAGGILAQYDSKTLTMQPYMIGKDRVSFQQWLAVKSWAEKNGYIFTNNGWENRRANIGANMAINYPVTSINIEDAMVWCNAYSEYYGKTPYYRDRGNNVNIIKNANSMKGGFDFSSVDNGGYRLPSREEYCFALFDGDARLRSYNHNGYSTYDYERMDFNSRNFTKTQISERGSRYSWDTSDPISLFTPNGALGLIGIFSQSSEFVEPWEYERDGGGYIYYKYLYNHHAQRNTDGFRIACSLVGSRSIASVTERYADQKKGW